MVCHAKNAERPNVASTSDEEDEVVVCLCQLFFCSSKFVDSICMSWSKTA